MKMTKSKDGISRATVRVAFRVSEQDLEAIAFATDMRASSEAPTKFRKATRAELEDALKSGFADGFWHEEEMEAYYEAKAAL